MSDIGERVYLSGPMSGIKGFNIPHFDEMAARARNEHFEVVNPAELDDPFFREVCLQCPTGSMEELAALCEKKGIHTATWGELLARDVELIADEGIEAVLALQGWEESRGARLETFVSLILCGIPLYTYPGLRPISPVDWYILTAPEAGDGEVVVKTVGATAVEGLYDKTMLEYDEPDLGRAAALTVGRMEFVLNDEVIQTDSKTGGMKGEKPEAFSLLPWKELGEVAKLYRAGAIKYDAHNWRKGYDWHLSFDSLMRHVTQWWEGESLDVETGCSHLSSVVFHALALMHFETNYPEKDNRPNVSRT